MKMNQREDNVSILAGNSINYHHHDGEIVVEAQLKAFEAALFRLQFLTENLTNSQQRSDFLRFYGELVHFGITFLCFRALLAAPAEAGGSIYFLQFTHHDKLFEYGFYHWQRY